MDGALVSIIIPSYNGALFLDRTIRTLTQQTYQNWEAIIVDDCSTDDTLHILRSIEDVRIKVHCLEENSGPAVARNTAIEKAQGRYIAFLDSDDTWAPDKLEKQISFMQEMGYAFTYHYYRKVNEEMIPIREFKPPVKLTYRKALQYNPLHTSSVIYDAKQIGKIYMPDIRKRQDYGLWFRLLKKVDGYVLPEFLSEYVQRPGSVSEKKLGLLKYNWALYRQHESMPIPLALYCITFDILSKVLRIK